jgi:hypothetical protein
VTLAGSKVRPMNSSPSIVFKEKIFTAHLTGFQSVVATEPTEF